MSQFSSYKKAIVTVLDTTTIQLNEVAIALMREELSYTAVYYQQQGQRKVRKEYQKSMINKDGTTLLGFFFRIKDFCKKQGIPLEIDDEYNLTGISGEGKIKQLSVKGKTLRTDQKDLVQQALRHERGILQAPMGTGKTVMLMGLLSCYPKKYKWLIFVPNLSLLQQTHKELKNHDFTNIITIGGKSNHRDYSTEELRRASIIITTAASFLNLLEDRVGSNWHDCIDGVLIDECHIGMKPDGRFVQIFKQLLAPIRIGLTATLPNDVDALLCLEGVVGPVIAHMSFSEAAELQLLAKPKLKMLRVPKNNKLAQVKTYQDIITHCLVNNPERNTLIVNAVRHIIKRNMSVIIFVIKIEHGTLLQEQLEQEGINSVFIQGSMVDTDREEVRQRMIAKKAQCVIATVVWREGINIPSLNAAIIAGGGKTTSGILQTVGRALRRTKDKKKALVIDFLDPYKYLAEHTVERMGIYVDQGWI